MHFRSLWRGWATSCRLHSSFSCTPVQGGRGCGVGKETGPTSLPGRWEGGKGCAGSWADVGTPSYSGWGALGRCGSVGRSACMRSPGTPSRGHGVLILAVYPMAGGSQLLSPSRCWMWPSPTLAGSCGHLLAIKGTAIGVLSEYGWPCPPCLGGGKVWHTPPQQLPFPSPIPKQVAASHKHPRDPLMHCSTPPHHGHPLSVPTGPGGRCQRPGSAVAERLPGVTPSRRLSATQRSPPASHAAADGGGDICLRVTCLTVAVSSASSLRLGWRSREPTWQK